MQSKPIFSPPRGAAAIRETTALARPTRRVATGFFRDLEDLRANWEQDRSWTPRPGIGRAERLYRLWKKASRGLRLDRAGVTVETS